MSQLISDFLREKQSFSSNNPSAIKVRFLNCHFFFCLLEYRYMSRYLRQQIIDFCNIVSIDSLDESCFIHSIIFHHEKSKISWFSHKSNSKFRQLFNRNFAFFLGLASQEVPATGSTVVQEGFVCTWPVQAIYLTAINNRCSSRLSKYKNSIIWHKHTQTKKHKHPCLQPRCPLPIL